MDFMVKFVAESTYYKYENDAFWKTASMRSCKPQIIKKTREVFVAMPSIITTYEVSNEKIE